MTETPTLRELVAQLDDDTVRAIVQTFVEGLFQGVAEHVTESILEHIADLGAEPVGPPPRLAPAPSPEPPAVPPSPQPDPEPRASRVTVQHTCEICGRKGSRRYVPIGDVKDDRWKCSPTATACAPQFKRPGIFTPPTTSDIPAKDIPANVTPAVASADSGSEQETEAKGHPALGVTARCQDCTRTWNLTGRVLQMAIDSHELKHSHIVTTYEVA